MSKESALERSKIYPGCRHLELFTRLFPSRESGLVFAVYVMMLVAHGMLATASRHGHSSYSYNTTAVVLICELLKLVMSSLFYFKDHNVASMVASISGDIKVMGLYLVPALLYCVSNNVFFLSISYFNPTTYAMFLQIRLLLTGVIYQILFKTSLTGKQWLSLLVLTLGCMVHAAGGGGTVSGKSEEGQESAMHLAFGSVFILIQIMCSVFAGVYNEYIIKGEGVNLHIMIHNIFMYIDSILCNIVLLCAKGDIQSVFTASAIESLYDPFVILMILNTSAYGILTSIFLKKLNSILKAFATAIELVLTALLCVPLFHIPLTLNTLMALNLICVAVVMYAQNPVQIKSQNNGEKKSIKEEDECIKV